MADFKTALAITLQHEGGYVNDPLDPGGETFRGISRKFHPEWRGWVLIDAGQREGPELDNLVEDFYEKTFWKFDGIGDQELANKIFDQAVNRGLESAVKLLQHILGITEDGLFGNQTLAETNSMRGLASKLRVVSIRKRFERVQQAPSQQKFLQGWVLRDAE